MFRLEQIPIVYLNVHCQICPDKNLNPVRCHKLCRKIINTRFSRRIIYIKGERKVNIRIRYSLLTSEYLHRLDIYFHWLIFYLKQCEKNNICDFSQNTRMSRFRNISTVYKTLIPPHFSYYVEYKPSYILK